MGPGEMREQAMRILDMIVEYKDGAMYYEAGQRHAEDVVHGMGLAGESNKAVTPGTNAPMQAGMVRMSD